VHHLRASALLDNAIPAPAPKLLVVDDVADNREILRRRFTRRGYEVTEADSGISALDLIGSNTFDIVLLDVVMPGMDGLTVLRKIRADWPQAILPVIMVTAKTEVQDVVTALQLGANDYITKPVEFSIALARVEAHVARRRAEVALQNRIGELTRLNEQLEHEIAERQQSQARVQQMTYRDGLTGLGNRMLLKEGLTQALKDQHGTSGNLAVLHINIDKFRAINDALGQSAGDDLIKAVGQRLEGIAAEAGLVARLGADEFAIVLKEVRDGEAAARFVEDVLNRLAHPYSLVGQQHVLSCSAGISIAPRDGVTAERLLTSASLALAATRAGKRGSYRFFDPSMNARAQERRTMEIDLRQALGRNQLAMHYQPLYDLRSEKITGFEALMRWDHPVGGMISPAEFIPLAEEIGMIGDLGVWAMRRACEDALTWPEEITVAVNISAVQLRDPALAQKVRETLISTGLGPERLELEITETALMEEGDLPARMLHDLRGLGVKVSLDDFGTGYSSLSYLSSFPFDKIKIDRSFIKDLPSDAVSVAIVRAVTSLAGALGAKVTAEGVETATQRELLRQEGCDQIQGYLISQALPLPKLSMLMKRDYRPA
jgi:diguanylate cyclase (GGDEF)-like protein